ncbi:MAG: hypothetical protein ABSF43_14510 [Rectinemataceae bacterium]|jgi:hypothetical protein
MNTEVIKLFGMLEQAWEEKNSAAFITEIEQEILIILIDKEILNGKAFYWSHERLYYSGNTSPFTALEHSTTIKGRVSL